jgi:hypothetical protein
MAYQFNGFYIPDRMMGALQRYVEFGAVPGDFLCAVIENDLSKAVGMADSENARNLPAYVGYLYNEAPAPCWGSPAKLVAWVEAKAAELAAKGAA